MKIVVVIAGLIVLYILIRLLVQFFLRHKKQPTHAGGIVYREINGVKEYLLVTTKYSSFIWVIPKGHVEEKEAEEKTAVREVKEESGMKATVIKKIGNAERLKLSLQKQVIAFYLMKFEKKTSDKTEGRKIGWFTYNDARRKLWYAYQRNIFKSI